MQNFISKTKGEGLTTWDIRFFQLCETISTWSEDESRKIGCVVVGPDNEIQTTGYNGLPRKIENLPARQNRKADEKYYWFEHAERNAIFNAVRTGTSLAGSRMYSGLFPCADCARAIIQSGISELNTFFPSAEKRYFRRSFEVSNEMMIEAGIVVRLFEKENWTQALCSSMAIGKNCE